MTCFFGLTDQALCFLVGQDVRVSVLRLSVPDLKGRSRIFSIVSPSGDKTKLSIASRDSDGGFKRTLMRLLPGALLEDAGC